MGWLGVALSGSGTALNVLLGGMQHVARNQLGLSFYLMDAAYSVSGSETRGSPGRSLYGAMSDRLTAHYYGRVTRFAASGFLKARLGCKL